MTRRLQRTVCGALGIGTVVLFLSVAWAAGQAPLPPRQPMAENVFKNVQVLKGVPADEFLGAMGFISNALAVNCTYCHLGEGGGGWSEYAKDNEKKQMARRMITMMRGINQTYFGGRRVVTCVSCHNGANRPKVVTNMAVYYNAKPTDEPDDIVKQVPGAPSADQVLDKYVQALGGAQRLAGLTSLVAKGTYLAYGEAEARPLEIYAKAPRQRTMIVHTFSGDSTTTYDGRVAWSSVPEAFTPVPLSALTSAELEGVKLDAELMFPGGVKLTLNNWRGAIPTAIGDRDVQVIQGAMTDSRFPVKLYFDDESGLLVRQVRYTETPIGRNSWQIDYDNYRDVGGVKVPLRWTILWQSGQATVELTDVQPNVPVDASRFAKPSPSAPPPARR